MQGSIAVDPIKALGMGIALGLAMVPVTALVLVTAMVLVADRIAVSETTTTVILEYFVLNEK